MSYEQLKQFASELKTQYPAHTRLLHSGLALALLGRVKLAEGGYKSGHVTSSTGEVYRVACKTPEGGWTCTCPQGQSFGPRIELFINQECKHFCKHIAALSICWLADKTPDKPASIFEALTALIDADEVPACNDSLPITKSVKLAHRDRAGKPVLELVNGHSRSLPLAVWATDSTGQNNRGYWKLLPEAGQRYEEFKAVVTGGSSVKVAA